MIIPLVNTLDYSLELDTQFGVERAMPCVEVKATFPSELRLPSGHLIVFNESNALPVIEVPKFNPKDFKSSSFQSQVEELLSKLAKLHPFYENAASLVKRNGYQFKIYSEDDKGLSKEVHDAMKGGASAMTNTASNLIFIKTNDLDSSINGQKEFISRLTNELVSGALDRESRRYSGAESEALFRDAMAAEKSGKLEFTPLESDLFAHFEVELASTIADEALVNFLYNNIKIEISAKSLEGDSFLKTRRKPNYLMGCLEAKFGSDALKKIEDAMRSQDKIPDDVKALLTRFGRRLSSTDTEEGIVKLLTSLKVIG